VSWAVVVPSNREAQIESFMQAWLPLFRKHQAAVYVVWDGPLSTRCTAATFTWEDIPDFIPRQTDMIRSWGIFQAWRSSRKHTYTLSLDDDVLPEGDPFEAFEEVFSAGAPCSDYLDVGALTSYDGQLRGFPFRDRQRSEVAIQYGGWHGVLDFDAPTQLATQPGEHRFADVVLPVPRGAAVTGCIMNCAWRTEYAPIMWQLPLDSQGRFNRFGDIWSCLFQKRVLDALGKVMVVNGKASVRHERASDPIANLERETPGVRLNEGLWRRTYDYSEDMTKCYRHVTNRAVAYLSQDDLQYARHFIACRDKWLALFA